MTRTKVNHRRQAAALLAAGALVALSAAPAFAHGGAPTSALDARAVLLAAERFDADDDEAGELDSLEPDEPEGEASDEQETPDRDIAPHHAAEDVDDDQGEDQAEGDQGEDQAEGDQGEDQAEGDQGEDEDGAQGDEDDQGEDEAEEGDDDHDGADDESEGSHDEDDGGGDGEHESDD